MKIYLAPRIAGESAILRQTESSQTRSGSSVFIARQHAEARYWYSNSVCLSVCPLRSGILWKRLNVLS